MHHFTTINLAWTNLSKLYGIDSLSVISSVEILLGRKDHKKYMSLESCTRLAVISVVYHYAKVVNLRDQT